MKKTMFSRSHESESASASETGIGQEFAQDNAISRRAFVASAAAIAAVAVAGGAVAAANATSGSNTAESDEGSAETAAASSNADRIAASSSSADASDSAHGEGGAGNVLVAYFSATGHTEAIAQIIAENLGADTFVLTPTTPYTSDDLNYNDQSSRVSNEVGQRDTIDVQLEQVTPDGFDGYDTIFVGYPIWWQDFSWVMGEFLTGNDFSGKTVIPFCTSAASPLGESAAHIAEKAGTGDWLDGQRFAIGTAEEDVVAWLDSIEL
jgi:flavodoxin